MRKTFARKIRQESSCLTFLQDLCNFRHTFFPAFSEVDGFYPGNYSPSGRFRAKISVLGATACSNLAASGRLSELLPIRK
jgi:hypothetical protein